MTIPFFLVWFAAAGFAGHAVSAQVPTAEQLRQLEAMSPEQRATLLDALGGQRSSREVPLPEPILVSPRSVVQPIITSSPSRDGDGGQGQTGSITLDQPRLDLKHFGYDLFAGTPSTFAPATDIPIPVDYVIGPGDTIEMQLFGGQNASFSLVVTREGIVNFPELGPVTVSGLRFSDLQATLQQRVSEQMIGVRISISMGRLRSIRVFVLGEAYRPGSYTVSSLSTMTNALFVSGGIKTIGSLRNVQLKRNGQLITTLDLYDLLLRGDTSGDRRLQPGDVLFIPTIGKTVGVGGEVRRPAIYELSDERTTQDMLTLAGGLLPTAYPKASKIERINQDKQRTVIDVDLSSEAGLQVTVAGDDQLHVYSVLEKREDIVVLSGHVHRSGIYQWTPGMRITDLLTSLDDLRLGADPGYVLVRREIQGSLDIEVVSVDLAAALRTPVSSDNLVLKPKDQVRVFDVDSNRSEIVRPIVEELQSQATRAAPSRIVSISGRVKMPGRYPLEPEMRVSDLIRAGGSLAEAAYGLEAELIRYTIGTGEVRKIELINVDLNRVLSGDQAADIMLAPFDFLNVKEIPQWRDSESVSIEGEVSFPGSYPIRRGERISSVIARAGGLTDTAFAEGAVFLRTELREREQERLDELSERLESEAAIAAAAKTDLPESTAARQALLDQLDSTVAMGRLVIDLKGILSSEGGAGADVVLNDGDRLLIPQQSQTVTIIGEVQYPTSHIYAPNISRNEYIDLSGGTSQHADKKRIYIVRADGAVVADTGSRFFRRRDAWDIQPGDTIVVPADADRIKKLTLWTNVSTIIYNIGVATAAVASFR